MIALAMLAYLIPTALYAVDATPAPTPIPAVENLNQALTSMIMGATKTAGQTKDFLVAQTPDAVRQLLAWKLAESFIYFLLSFLLAAAILFNLRKFINFGIKENWGDDEYKDNVSIEHEQMIPVLVIWGISSAVLIIVGTIIAFSIFNLNWLQIWIAPKVYLIEYAKTLITGH